MTAHQFNDQWTVLNIVALRDKVASLTERIAALERIIERRGKRGPSSMYDTQL